MFDAEIDQPSKSQQYWLHKEGGRRANRKKGPDNAMQMAAMYNSHRQLSLLIPGLERVCLGFVSSKQHTWKPATVVESCLSMMLN
jgi:hypothetical protein